MFFSIHCIIILLTIPFSLGVMNLKVDGALNLGPTWSYEYHIKHYTTESYDDGSHTILGKRLTSGHKDRSYLGPQMIDIIIKNNQSNPNVVKIAEAHIYDDLRNGTVTINIPHFAQIPDKKYTKGLEEYKNAPVMPSKVNKQEVKDISDKQKESFKSIDVHTEPPITPSKVKKHKSKRYKITTNEYSNNLVRNGQIDSSRSSEEHTDPPKKVKKQKIKRTGSKIETYFNNLVKFKDQSLKFSDEHTDYTIQPNNGKKQYLRGNDTKTGEVDVDNVDPLTDSPKISSKKHKDATIQPNVENYEQIDETATGDDHRNDKKTTFRVRYTVAPELIEPHKRLRHKQDKVITIEDFPKRVTSLIDLANYKDIYVKPHKVKDDTKIKEFTKHIYEQSVKTFENIKDKMVNYEMRREADLLLRSYEEKFGEFVRETQEQQIKTRLGRQKVIFNTVDTSNRILERLVNYLLGKMDKRGVLRHEGSENVILNELNKKKELEDKHICSKMHICRNQETFTNFVRDLITIVLSSDDTKVISARDAYTEVLTNTDFSHVMNEESEKRLHKGMKTREKTDVKVLRPMLMILKNIIVFKNSPIRVVGPEDSRVNKTMAFLELMDMLDKHLPPNEQNILEWTDLKNSFTEWSEKQRNDTLDLVQSFMDHVTKTLNNLNDHDAKNFERNTNILLR